MKKKVLFVALGALLALTGCGEGGNGGSTGGDGGKDITLLPSALKEKYIAKLVGTYNEVGSDEKTAVNYTIDQGTDHLSILAAANGKYVCPTFFYVKNAIGGVDSQYINAKNAVASVSLTDNAFEETFPNVFASIADKDIASLVLANDGALTELGQNLFDHLFFGSVAGDGLEGASNFASSISFGAKKAVYSLSFDVPGEGEGEPAIHHSYEMTVEDPSNYRAITLSKMAANEKTEAFASFVETLKGNNYTCTVKEAGEVAAIYSVNAGGYIEEKDGAKKGFVKKDSGYQNIIINDKGEAILGAAAQEAYGSLVPTFDFASEIFDADGDLTPSALTQFEASGLKNALFFNDIAIDENLSSLNATVADGKMTVTLDGETEIVFDQVGTTSLGADIFNARAKMDWSENAEAHEKLKLVLGEDYELPYWEGLDWTVNYGSQLPNISLSADFEDLDEAAAAMSSYVALLAKYPQQYVKWTDEEWENTKNSSVAGTHDEGTDELYHLNDDFSMEVCAVDQIYYIDVEVNIYPTSYFLK